MVFITSPGNFPSLNIVCANFEPASVTKVITPNTSRAVTRPKYASIEPSTGWVFQFCPIDTQRNTSANIAKIEQNTVNMIRKNV